MNIETTIKSMPKVILHLHLDGSLRPETVYEWLKEEYHNITLNEVKQEMKVSDNCTNLNEYLEKFKLPLSVLQSKEHIERAVYELYEDLAKQNVIYAEVRFAPILHLVSGLSLDDVVLAAIRGSNIAKQKFHIDGSLILCCMRDDSIDGISKNMAVVNIAKKYLGKGVCAIDLAGAESLYPTEYFRYIFDYANNINIPFTIHAGEAAGYLSIETALNFGAKRIGHGIRCTENENLMERLKKEKITLEICPTSNIQTKSIEGLLPIKKIYDSGILITINTDNDTVSNINITDEYLNVINNYGFKVEDLIKLNINAANSIFAPNELKEKLKEKIQKFK